VDSGIGAISNERFRLLFPFVLPFWDMPLMDWMQQEHGAVIVMDLLNSWADEGKWFQDPDKPIENLARKTFLHPAACQLHGPLDILLESMIQNALDYKADGAVFFSHIGCRQACAAIRAMKDEFQERLGLPIAIIDCDIIDKSFASREEVQEKMEGFFERLEEQKESSSSLRP
jgi:benzoyl-CoA reductase/2-hydroxyglutaryl-CoA dehydratase subunit BcrC/BadD/HgdB